MVDPGRDRRITLRWIFSKWHVDKYDFVHDSDRWRALENPVMNILTVQSARLSRGEQSYLREYTWCVLGGTGHQWLYIK